LSKRQACPHRVERSENQSFCRTPPNDRRVAPVIRTFHAHRGLTSRGFVAAGDTAVPPLSTVVLLAPALSSASSLFLRRRVCCSARPAVVRHHRHNGWLTPTDPRLNVRAGRGLRRTLGCVLGPDRETTCPAAAAVSGGNVSFSAAGIDVCGCTVETTTVADCRRCRPPPSVDGCCR